MNPADDEYLRPTAIVDADHPAVIRFAREAAGTAQDPRARAVALYYAVRDGFRYDPYGLDLSPQGLSASRVLETGRGWCVTKAVLLAAACRALGIPARLGYADVRNHLSTERMRQAMKTDVFYWHGYTGIRLDGRWVKATPAFNLSLCEKFRLKPLEFDGSEDSIYHPFDLEGRRHMEYLNFRGEYADVPVADIVRTFAEHYPGSLAQDRADFDRDVARETAGG
ncbi:MAG TPA: transglutaminase family protein [Nevskiales bacterium]|nr:transglutaminase family protein [Nevskiales bacterium]